MKSPFRLAAATLSVLVGAAPASAYTLMPLNTGSHLKGTLKFVNGGEGGNFRCQVDLLLKTRDPSKGIGKNARIAKAKIVFPSRSCPATVSFSQNPPWWAGASGPDTGLLADGGWTAGGNTSCGGAETAFTVDAQGVWTVMPGGCFAGSLTSTPPITIGQ